ncbi:MAG: hypothetical protein JNM36_00175 [Chitinophagales bacterium]|jgi:hypothetical protein|nr:hypothetical protein [Chitinophagales bacterium]
MSNKKVHMVESIIIKASAENIFEYVSNSNNDPKWRTEVDRMDVQGEIKVGTLIVEYSSFYKFLHTITPAEIKEFDKPNKIILETPENHPTWLQVIRTIKKIGNEECTFTYEVAFSIDFMKQIMPFTPPAALIVMWYRPRIKKYLRNLKGLLEQSKGQK